MRRQRLHRLHRDWLLADDPGPRGPARPSALQAVRGDVLPVAGPTRTAPRASTAGSSRTTRSSCCHPRRTAGRASGSAARRTSARVCDPHELLDWCELESEAWGRVQEVACHHRHWRTRVKLIEQVEAAASATGSRRSPSASRSSRERPAGRRADGLDARVHENDMRLRALAATRVAKREHACRLIADLRRQRASLGLIDAPDWKPRKADVARLCDAHAALWRTLRRCLEDERGRPRLHGAIEAAAVAPGSRRRRAGQLAARARPAATRPAAAHRAPAAPRRQLLIRSEAPIAPPRSPSSASTNGGGFSLANRCGSMAFSIFSR